jgi:hypothetical protein
MSSARRAFTSTLVMIFHRFLLGMVLCWTGLTGYGQDLQQLRNPFTADSEEIIASRTRYSRSFLHGSGVTTTAMASYPLHFRDGEGIWQPIRYRRVLEGRHFIYPADEPRYTVEAGLGSWQFFGPDAEVWLKVRPAGLTQYAADGQVLGMAVPQESEAGPRAQPEEYLAATDIYPDVDLRIDLHAHYLKTGYLLKAPHTLLAEASYWVLEEELTLPEGFTLALEGEAEHPGRGRRLVLHDNRGRRVVTLAQPICRDSRPEQWQAEAGVTGRSLASTKASMRDATALEGYYQLRAAGPGRYTLGILVPAEWLKHPDRVFPVWVDPIATLEDLTPLESCFLPEYSSGAMTLPVPEGDTILSAYFEWDYTAVEQTQGWVEDQYSYVSGPLGQTQVFIGDDSNSGVRTYAASSGICNVRSEGEVEVAFHAARVWGGSECGLEFNFISRRYVEILHAKDIVFGEGKVRVNEYSASNRSLLDGFGNYEDWIELYNDADEFVSLEGYFLSDDPADAKKWTCPGGLLFPRGHLMVLCSGRDTLAGIIPHTNFRLSQWKPEHILLSSPDGLLLDSIVLFRTQIGHSYGRLQSGTEEWGVFAQPTPGNANFGGSGGYAVTPVILPEPGFYSTPVAVSIEADTSGGAEIRYTTNGQLPTASSPLYIGPFTVDSTQVVRARLFSGGTEPVLLPGFVATHSYFIREPHALPVFSVSGDQVANLFAGHQISPLGAVEFFGADGRFVEGTVCEFNKHGNDSWKYPQRGVDFIARDEFGYKAELVYPFFGTTPRTRWQRLMLKAAANDNYPHEAGGAHLRDAYIQHLSQVSGLNLDERSTAFCVLYVNGRYWGVYDLRERVDDNDYTDFYYNQDRRFKGSEEYLQYLKTWGTTRPKFGEQKATQDWQALRQFVAQNHMGPGPAFEQLAEQLDISSLIDYFVINSFAVSRDWLNYNTGWWRGTNPEGEGRKWRYTLWDMDGALGHYINFTGIADVSAQAPPCQVDTIKVGNGHTAILGKLIGQNPEVRRQYVTRYADLMNTHFSYPRLSSLLDSMLGVFGPEMPGQIERWGGSLEEWQDNVETLREWVAERCASLVTGLADCYSLSGPYPVLLDVQPPGTGRIRMNSEWLPYYPFEAAMYGQIESHFTADAHPSYIFSHWEVEGLEGIDLQNPHLRDSVGQPVRLVAHFNDANLGDRELLYYWHFNTLNTPDEDVISITADYSYLPDQEARMTYTGTGPRDMDHFNTGSDLNLLMSQGAGRAVRVRNPSIGRSLVFNMPTPGMGNLRFEYAVQRSAQGMLTNILSYSLDGLQFTQAGLSTLVVPVSEEHDLVTLDFDGVPGAENNPDFHVRIEFQGNTTAGNGNNRFDNISLKGQEIPVSVRPVTPELSHWRVFPNPASGTLLVEQLRPEVVRHAYLVNMTGQMLPLSGRIQGPLSVLDIRGLAPGMYVLCIEGETGEGRIRFVKR